MAEAAEWTRTITVAYHHLFNGHGKLVLIGQQGSGRTMSQVMYGFVDGDGEEGAQPFPRLPIWIDLALLPQLKREEKTSGIEGLYGSGRTLHARGAAQVASAAHTP